METNQGKKRRLMLTQLVFAIGVLLGMLFYGAATWGDIEASQFVPSLKGDATLSGLRCPVVIGHKEIGEINVLLTNPTDKELQRTLRVQISEGDISSFRETTSKVSMEANGEQQLSWPVTADDSVWNHFIMVRGYLFSNYPLPSESGSCGVLVVNLFNLPGNLIVVFVLVTSLVCMGFGLWLWTKLNSPLRGRRLNAAYAMGGIAFVVTAGILASVAGWWTVSALLLVTGVLLVMVVSTYFIQTSEA